MKPEEFKISSEKFNFANSNKSLHDKELDTKPISYFKDAFSRFKKNKASIVATIIICFLVLYAIIVPIVSPYSVSYTDENYRGTLPKVEFLAETNVLDGCKEQDMNEITFLINYSMGVETGHNTIKNQEYEKYTITQKSKNPNTGKMEEKEVNMYKARVDTYHKVGTVFKLLTLDEYKELQAYQDEHEVQIIYPITKLKLRPTHAIYEKDANIWFATKQIGQQMVPIVEIDENGVISFENIYDKLSFNDDGTPILKSDPYTSKMRVEGADTPLYKYSRKNDGDMYEVRVNYYEYYIYYHQHILKDRITKPSFIFGTSVSSGQDIFTCLASGARFSFILAIIVATVNLVVGAIYGAIEGYYGGKIDLIMERFVEILSAVPFMIVITLLKYHMPGSNHVLILFISFFLTGWIGMAGRTRMQFYRFKNQEYVLASRTLGAKDWRIMFKHIFPNSLGTLVTSCVLVIPSMIFSETSLSYLGIINLNSGNMTSVGTLLANGQPYLVTYPHMILFPAIFISLLMLSFNLFGNGLRDAFNPSLRGTED